MSLLKSLKGQVRSGDAAIHWTYTPAEASADPDIVDSSWTDFRDLPVMPVRQRLDLALKLVSPDALPATPHNHIADIDGKWIIRRPAPPISLQNGGQWASWVNGDDPTEAAMVTTSLQVVNLPARVTVIASRQAWLTKLFRLVVALCCVDACDLAIIHGAACRRRHETVILIGPSDSGKSTLALAAAGSGWTVLGEDFLLVDRFFMPIRFFLTGDWECRLTLPALQAVQDLIGIHDLPSPSSDSDSRGRHKLHLDPPREQPLVRAQPPITFVILPPLKPHDVPAWLGAEVARRGTVAAMSAILGLAPEPLSTRTVDIAAASMRRHPAVPFPQTRDPARDVRAFTALLRSISGV